MFIFIIYFFPVLFHITNVHVNNNKPKTHIQIKIRLGWVVSPDQNNYYKVK